MGNRVGRTERWLNHSAKQRAVFTVAANQIQHSGISKKTLYQVLGVTLPFKALEKNVQSPVTSQ